MAENFDKLMSIFQEALEKHPPDSWDQFVREAAEGDEELYRQVCQLLESHAHGGSLLDRPAVTALPTVDLPITEGPGTVIGPYKLLQQIGEGGFGVVYMADQREPVKRRVALKIIKPGMDSRQVIARFEAERQALAMMDHPNIAKVLGAGTTDSGRPYFVMELVKGVPITQYCDEKRLTPRQRLELFVPVCQALQHAHQKGIIHRDIKPSNVMVAKYDDRPVPKVIDFGVVKAIEQHLTEKTMFTQYGQIVGTVDYMSPEQADLNQLDIDTRSDIYSLGVLLYELLTGETPFDRQRLRLAAFGELLRIIREEEPPKPSLRLSSSESLPSIAANRHVEPKKLSTLVHGELDWIVMKALEKDRTRRYETANGLANDVQRYLNDEAVVACPPSAGYRFRKFARRNKVVIAMGSVVAAALMVGIAGLVASNALVSRQRDAKERALGELNVAFQEKDQALQQAEANFNLAMDALDEVYIKSIGRERLLLTDVKNRSRQNLRRQIPLTEQEQRLLGQGLEFYVQFAQQNADNPDARFEVGQAYKRVAKLQLNLGKRDAAAAALQQASDSLTRLSADYPDQAYFVEELAEVYQTMASIQGSSEPLRTAVQLFSKALALDPQDAGLYEKRARVHALMHQTEEALADYRRCLELDPDDATCHKKLARLYQSTGQTKQAIAHFQRSLELDPSEDNCHFQLADLFLGAAGHMPDSARLAVRHAREAVRLEEGNPYFQKILIRALIQAGEQAEVLEYAKLAVERDPTGASYGLLVNAYVALGDLDQALAAADESVQRYERLIAESPDNQQYRADLGHTLRGLAELLEATKRIPLAEEVTRRAERLRGMVLIEQITKVPDVASVSYRVRIATPGEYRLYLRWDGHDANSDSVYVHLVELTDGLGGSVADFYGYEIPLYSGDVDFATPPVWQGSAGFEVEAVNVKGDPAVWTIATPGNYTIRFVMREDGVALDALALQLSSQPEPEGDGPAESATAGDKTYLESDGRVVVEAEHFADRRAGRTNWRVVPDEDPGDVVHLNYRGTGYLQALPDSTPEIPADIVTYRGHGKAHTGRWDEALAHFAEAKQLRPDDVMPWYYQAAASLALDDTEGFRQICAGMLERFGQTVDPEQAHWVAWTCALAPEAVSDLVATVQLAEQAMTTKTPSDQNRNTLGAILYRAGQFEAAIEDLDRVVAAWDQHSMPTLHSPAYTWFFLAMAHHRHGSADEAREYLEQATERAEQEIKDNPIWNRRLTLELLRREATALLSQEDLKPDKSESKKPGAASPAEKDGKPDE